MEKLLTVKELAELLRVNPGSVYHWISAGRLPVVRFSARCVRFRESEVTKLLDELQSVANQGEGRKSTTRRKKEWQ